MSPLYPWPLVPFTTIYKMKKYSTIDYCIFSEEILKGKLRFHPTFYAKFKMEFLRCAIILGLR